MRRRSALAAAIGAAAVAGAAAYESAPGPEYFMGDTTLALNYLDTSSYPDALCNGAFAQRILQPLIMGVARLRVAQGPSVSLYGSQKHVCLAWRSGVARDGPDAGLLGGSPNCRQPFYRL